MGWKASGEPTVREQRSKWVVRIDGIDTETGQHRPRQVTFESRRAALNAARTAAAEGRTAERGTVGWLVRRHVTSRTDVSLSQQYEWAIPHVEAGLGAIRLDRLDRDEVARWLHAMARDGKLSRSIHVCPQRAANCAGRRCQGGADPPQSGCPRRSAPRHRQAGSRA
ncbi:MAG: hypothetical protein ACHQNA_05610 [Acidimicrobiales bacterium]